MLKFGVKSQSQCPCFQSNVQELPAVFTNQNNFSLEQDRKIPVDMLKI